jgi:protein-S-isoprenylcysteine O-methyltransferase Ste14
MRLETDAIGLTALILVSFAYVLFGGVFLFRRRPPQTEEAKRAPAATLGMVLQGVSFLLAWNPARPEWWPFPPSRAGEVALAAAAIMLAYASCWLSIRAAQTLGKQWTYAARIIKGHQLVTQGPYGVVRNPIPWNVRSDSLDVPRIFSLVERARGCRVLSHWQPHSHPR